MSVLLETSLGDIVIDTFYVKCETPALNFIKLCKLKYYNDSELFYIQSNFVARTGDPTNNNGTGHTSIHAQCNSTETTLPPQQLLLPGGCNMSVSHAKKGIVSFTAAAGVRSTDGSPMYGSQFFLTLANGLDYLDDAGHTIFGFVSEGMHILDKISNEPVDKNGRPFRLLRIRHTIILDDPFEDPIGLNPPPHSPQPNQTIPNDRLASDDDDTDEENENGLTTVEKLENIQKEQDEREANSRAQVLEMVGDIRDAELKPPENVLFVCKLNAVTDAEGLQIIFSRFGDCHVDVITDKQNGESLCYGFIEFENKNQCEKAYFKMNNSLIDDRFIRVDFSQSVSKLWNDMHRYKNIYRQQQLTTNKQFLSSTRPMQFPSNEGYHQQRQGDASASDAQGPYQGFDGSDGSFQPKRKRKRRTRFDIA